MQVDRRGDRGSPLESGIVTAATSWVEAASARQGENYLFCLRAEDCDSQTGQHCILRPPSYGATRGGHS